jgi:hypothetical protein
LSLLHWNILLDSDLNPWVLAFLGKELLSGCLSFLGHMIHSLNVIIIWFIFVFLLCFIKIILSCRYCKEESNTMFDADSSSLFLGDKASFLKKEAELAKKMVCCNCLKWFFIWKHA